MSDNPSSSSLLNEEETLVPLRDDNAKRSRHNSDDAETVSSAPPRIEVQVNSSMLREVHADTNNNDAIDDVNRDSSSNITEANGGDSNHHHRTSSAPPLLTTPTNKNTSLSLSTNSEEQQISASTKKFVTFLSDVDSTPIASSNTNKQFVEDDMNDANDMMMVEQPSLMDDADEKKEDNTVISTTATLTSRGYSREYSESTLDSWQNTASADTDGNGTSITEGTISPLPMIMQENDDNVSSSANNDEDMAPSSIIETVHTSLQVKATPPPSRPTPPPAIDTTIHNTQQSSSSRNNTALYASQHPNRRSITLRLVEEISKNNNTDHLTSSLHSNVLTTPFKRLTSLRKFRSLSLSTVMIPAEKKMDMTDRQNNNNNNNNTSTVNDMSEGDTRLSNDDGVTNVERGIISVTWYEGTTSKEMQDHVYNCVLRKLKSSGGGGSSNALKGTMLEDVRLLDENVVPHEGSFLFMYSLYYFFCLT